ncbi:LOW QUALITY PROTEIN: transmembrane protein 102 [Carettochelys insculpta]|uniref:LOW QUALITY PROTEIN: transmembrane protein 102 n=1 Tax=Carettochelys insculpta TaxID=44489 RepID=UPI003EC11A72
MDVNLRRDPPPCRQAAPAPSRHCCCAQAASAPSALPPPPPKPRPASVSCGTDARPASGVRFRQPSQDELAPRQRHQPTKVYIYPVHPETPPPSRDPSPGRREQRWKEEAGTLARGAGTNQATATDSEDGPPEVPASGHTRYYKGPEPSTKNWVYRPAEEGELVSPGGTWRRRRREAGFPALSQPPPPPPPPPHRRDPGVRASWTARSPGPWAPQSGGTAPRPARPLTDLDFHSGAWIAELNRLVQELSKQPWRDPGVRAAPELLVLKDFVFSLLGRVHQLEGKLPPSNEYLLLSGGVLQGTVDVDPGALGCYVPDVDYDVDYTLLVPVLQAHDSPVPLDLRGVPPGHARLPLAPFGPEAHRHWADCCQHHGGQGYLAPGLVSAWFCQALVAVADQARAAPHRGGPNVEQAARHGGLVTLIARHGPWRVLYDVLPVVSFRGWPAAAQAWLDRAHFWEGKLREEDVAEGFYLLPAPTLAWQEAAGPAEALKQGELVENAGTAGRGAENPAEVSNLAWRLSFCRSELHLKQMVPLPLLQAYGAARSALSAAWAGRVGPYHLWSLVLGACERLPARYLAREENTAHCLLGLLTTWRPGLARGTSPHYFLPGCNRLEGGLGAGLAHAVAAVRGHPVENLQRAVERVKAAAKLARVADAGSAAEE